MNTKNIFFVLVLFTIGVSWVDAATYTVCASGCTSTTIQKVFSTKDLAPGDVVEIQADNVGGTKIYREVVTFGTDDQGTPESPVVLRGRVGDTIVLNGDINDDGKSDIGSLIKITNVNHVEVQNLSLTKPIIQGILINGSSTGVVIRGITSTHSGNQAFQMEGTASATFYNIVGNNNADDGFSMHNDTTAVIYGGSFSNNVDGVNIVGGASLTATDITITKSSTEAILFTGVTKGIRANLTNVSIDQSGSLFTTPVIALVGTPVLGTFKNITVNNTPLGTAPTVIDIKNGATAVFDGLMLTGNPSDDPIGIRAVSSGLLTVIHSKIDNFAQGVFVNSNPVFISNTVFQNIKSRGVFTSSNSYAVRCINTPSCTVENNSFVDGDTAGAIYIDAPSAVLKNNTITRFLNGIFITKKVTSFVNECTVFVDTVYPFVGVKWGGGNSSTSCLL